MTTQTTVVTSAGRASGSGPDPQQDIRVRGAKPSDVPALLELEQTFPAGDQISIRSWRRFIRAGGVVWVADLGGVIAGAAVMLRRAGSRKARLYSLATLSVLRGKGVARALVQHCENEARRCGAAALQLEVRPDNTAARALYVSLGFQVTGQKAEFYADGAEATVMAKFLTESGAAS